MAQSRYASLQLPVSDASNWIRGGGVFVSADFDLSDSSTWTGIVIDPGGDILGEDYKGLTAWNSGETYFHLSPDGLEIGNYLAGGSGAWFDLDDAQFYLRANLLVESFPGFPPDRFQQLYLSFDEGDGDRYMDSSKNKYDFVACSTAPSSRDTGGASGSWVNFNGVGGIQSVDTSTEGLNLYSLNFLISFWASVSSSSTTYVLHRGVYSTSTAYGWGIYYDGANNQMVFYGNRGSGLTPYTYGSGASSVEEGSIKHFCFIRVGVNWYWYIESDLIASGTNFQNILTDSARQMFVGTTNSSGTYALAGKVDELRIYRHIDYEFSELNAKGLYLNPSGTKGGRITAGALVIGDLPTSTGFFIDKTGFWSFYSGIQLRGMALEATAWQRTVSADVSPINAGFILDVGDEVIGGFNYIHPPTSAEYGGILYDLSERELEIRAALVTSGCRVPAGETFALYGTFEVHGNINIHDGHDLFFYDSADPNRIVSGVGSGSVPIGSSTFQGMLMVTTIDGSGTPYPLMLGSGIAGSTIYNAGVIVIASPSSGSDRAIIVPSINTNGNYGVHIGDPNFQFRMGYFRGMTVYSGASLWLGTSISKFRLNIDGVGSYWAYITPS